MRRLVFALVLLAACQREPAVSLTVAPSAHATPTNAAPANAAAANAAPANAAVANAAPANAAPAGGGSLSCAAIEGCVGHCATDDKACAQACVARLQPAARPYFERLQACVEPACANSNGGAAPCHDPSSFACKLCAMSRCGALASACLAH